MANNGHPQSLQGTTQWTVPTLSRDSCHPAWAFSDQHLHNITRLLMESTQHSMFAFLNQLYLLENQCSQRLPPPQASANADSRMSSINGNHVTSLFLSPDTRGTQQNQPSTSRYQRGPQIRHSPFAFRVIILIKADLGWAGGPFFQLAETEAI